MTGVNSDIGMIIKICSHCGEFIEDCSYQREMRGFGLDIYVDIWTKELEVGPWTSSNGQSEPPIEFTETG